MVEPETAGSTFNEVKDMDWFPLWNSLRIAAFSSILVFFSGIFLAYYVAKLPKTVKGVLDVLLTLPLVLPPTVCGWFLLIIFGLTHPFEPCLIDHVCGLVARNTSIL